MKSRQSPISKAFSTISEGMSGVIHDFGEGAPMPVQQLGEEHISLLEEAIGQEQAQPSIVWVPIGGPGKLEGNLRSETSIRTPAGVSQPRQLMSVESRMDVYFWAPNVDDAWWMFCHWVHVARTVLTAYSYNEPMGIRWAMTTPSGEPARGTYLIHTFHLSIPVTFEPQPVARAPLTPNVTGTIATPSQITTPQGEQLS